MSTPYADRLRALQEAERTHEMITNIVSHDTITGMAHIPHGRIIRRHIASTRKITARTIWRRYHAQCND